MSSICFYFQVHQPYRLRKYGVFDVGSGGGYFDETGENNRNNERIFTKVAEKCYLPANKMWLTLIKRHPELRLTYSLTGTIIEQMERWSPETLSGFQALLATGQVELLAETYYHSLSLLYSPEEFRAQLTLHGGIIERVFGKKHKPSVFRNTELIWHDKFATELESLGYKGVIAEGADDILSGRTPNFIYNSNGDTNLPMLLKNYRLSDDIAFRFGEQSWSEWPLDASKFADWVASTNGSGEVVNLFMDYETFGEHQWEDTGIFKFLEALPNAIRAKRDMDFVTASEAIKRYPTRDVVAFPRFVSWADIERDTSAWCGNPMQDDALSRLYSMRERILATGDKNIIRDWRLLTTSDHFYYMCTKWFQDGDVHKYFNPHESPYDAYIAFVNVLADLEQRLTLNSKKIMGRKIISKRTKDEVKNRATAKISTTNRKIARRKGVK
ncbi:MAG: alpha-amylase [Candidatus Vogelbacteria bacterium CG10_big_fil_rev_8_21_14_0_10_45_14]|uniref:Alpha-amylase n=1 Tax=Candidatus Vogelbacteria bacterium CG10_big_fil_rev_8_21_14_0_10_45_14 TaxID=1975042 RepID=A0A2H0RKM2_9BACT|nr:MAG: alpha-amylase [Candidatus Vogelbacteria bacterium CG10_big_fil_rev_8_21_14_0_10_45_14]